MRTGTRASAVQDCLFFALERPPRAQRFQHHGPQVLLILLLLTAIAILAGCGAPTVDLGEDGQAALEMESTAGEADANGFVWKTEQFADLKMIRYQVPGWSQLTDDQKKLAYCLTQAGLSGRDIMYDQNNRFNLRVRDMIDTAHENFKGDRGTLGWQRFHTFAKRVWFSNGIHHHYSNAKITPECSRAYFEHVITESGMASKRTSWRPSMPCTTRHRK